MKALTPADAQEGKALVDEGDAIDKAAYDAKMKTYLDGQYHDDLSGFVESINTDIHSGHMTAKCEVRTSLKIPYGSMAYDVRSMIKKDIGDAFYAGGWSAWWNLHSRDKEGEPASDSHLDTIGLTLTPIKGDE